MLYQCMCCGFVKYFDNGEDAFRAGWDAPPHFTGYVCCDLCPGSFVVLGMTHQHEHQHKKWAKEGRPKAFEIPTDENGKEL